MERNSSEFSALQFSDRQRSPEPYPRASGHGRLGLRSLRLHRYRSCVGGDLYSVSFAVMRRTREIGIRLANRGIAFDNYRANPFPVAAGSGRRTRGRYGHGLSADALHRIPCQRCVGVQHGNFCVCGRAAGRGCDPRSARGETGPAGRASIRIAELPSGEFLQARRFAKSTPSRRKLRAPRPGLEDAERSGGCRDPARTYFRTGPQRSSEVFQDRVEVHAAPPPRRRISFDETASGSEGWVFPAPKNQRAY
jgi:hypothetical protein